MGKESELRYGQALDFVRTLPVDLRARVEVANQQLPLQFRQLFENNSEHRLQAIATDFMNWLCPHIPNGISENILDRYRGSHERLIEAVVGAIAFISMKRITELLDASEYQILNDEMLLGNEHGFVGDDLQRNLATLQAVSFIPDVNFPDEARLALVNNAIRSVLAPETAVK